ncbi:MAG: hypothetical protein ACI8UR_000181 [Natronomonas sp.]|jgi:hypothetical protein|uniref:hypothetical protein n=1 Tax=Natronomonas sp. TaxID=2184060 RepID=UPI003988AB70
MIEQYLERLFTWESLENTERGVEFELKNRLIEAEFEGVTVVKLDGKSIPLEDITLELSADERYRADKITPESPLELDLAETVQVICDRKRLRLGVHEVEMGLQVEGYGEVDFTTDDEIRMEDLIDVDPADMTVAELRELAGDITEPKTFERLLEREREGKARKTAIELLEERHEAAEPLDESEMVRSEIPERDTGGGSVNELLVDVFESPQRVSVYLTVQTLGSGTPEEIASRTVFPERVVASTLEDFESEGIAERTADDAYTVASPVKVLQKRQSELWSVLRGTM